MVYSTRNRKEDNLEVLEYLLSAVKEDKVGDLRLGQLLLNVVPNNDSLLYNIEGDSLLSLLKSYLEGK